MSVVNVTAGTEKGFFLGIWAALDITENIFRARKAF